jgi:pyrrolidone-carboxylate peptidase
VKRVAINLKDTIIPDNDSNIPEGELIIPGGETLQ